MTILAIDTSTRWAGVGLQAGDGRFYERTWRSEQNHGRELLPAVEEVFSEAGVTAADLTHLGVAVGPGGFSAVRVGMSAATGLAMVNDIPMAAISTHLVEAEPYLARSSADAPLFSVLPAGRGDVAWARFEGSHEPVETGVAAPQELAESMPAGARICGEAVEEFTRLLPGDSFVGTVPPTRSPGTLIRLTTRAVERGEAVTGSALKPVYARPPSISQPRTPA